jgi:hypothetical protein
VHKILVEWKEDTYERRQSLADTIAQRPLKIISIFEQPVQAHSHVPVFTRDEVSLNTLTDYETLMGVGKIHSSLAKFTSGTEDHSFLQFCSGLKIMLDHWVDLNQTLEMNLLPFESLHNLDGNDKWLARLGRVDYKPMRGQIDFTKLGSWIHFPANNTTWMNVS